MEANSLVPRSSSLPLPIPSTDEQKGFNLAVAFQEDYRREQEPEKGPRELLFFKVGEKVFEVDADELKAIEATLADMQNPENAVILQETISLLNQLDGISADDLAESIVQTQLADDQEKERRKKELARVLEVSRECSKIYNKYGKEGLNKINKLSTDPVASGWVELDNRTKSLRALSNTPPTSYLRQTGSAIMTTARLTGRGVQLMGKVVSVGQTAYNVVETCNRVVPIAKPLLLTAAGVALSSQPGGLFFLWNGLRAVMAVL